MCDLIDQKCHLEGSRSNPWWAGSKSLPLMALESGGAGNGLQGWQRMANDFFGEC